MNNLIKTSAFVIAVSLSMASSAMASTSVKDGNSIQARNEHVDPQQRPKYLAGSNNYIPENQRPKYLARNEHLNPQDRPSYLS